MSEVVIKMLDDLSSRFGIAIDWSSNNVLPYLQDVMSRYIKYDIACHVIGIVISSILVLDCILAIMVVVENYNKVKKTDKDTVLWEFFFQDDIEPTAFGIIILTVTTITLIVCIVILGFNIASIIEDVFIPEKAIISYLMSLK